MKEKCQRNRTKAEQKNSFLSEMSEISFLGGSSGAEIRSARSVFSDTSDKTCQRCQKLWRAWSNKLPSNKILNFIFVSKKTYACNRRKQKPATVGPCPHCPLNP